MHLIAKLYYHKKCGYNANVKIESNGAGCVPKCMLNLWHMQRWSSLHSFPVKRGMEKDRSWADRASNVCSSVRNTQHNRLQTYFLIVFCDLIRALSHIVLLILVCLRDALPKQLRKTQRQFMLLWGVKIFLVLLVQTVEGQIRLWWVTKGN